MLTAPSALHSHCGPGVEKQISTINKEKSRGIPRRVLPAASPYPIARNRPKGLYKARLSMPDWPTHILLSNKKYVRVTHTCGSCIQGAYDKRRPRWRGAALRGSPGSGAILFQLVCARILNIIYLKIDDLLAHGKNVVCLKTDDSIAHGYYLSNLFIISDHRYYYRCEDGVFSTSSFKLHTLTPNP